MSDFPAQDEAFDVGEQRDGLEGQRVLCQHGALAEVVGELAQVVFLRIAGAHLLQLGMGTVGERVGELCVEVTEQLFLVGHCGLGSCVAKLGRRRVAVWQSVCWWG